jgi:hypothetical protein
MGTPFTRWAVSHKRTKEVSSGLLERIVHAIQCRSPRQAPVLVSRWADGKNAGVSSPSGFSGQASVLRDSVGPECSQPGRGSPNLWYAFPNGGGNRDLRSPTFGRLGIADRVATSCARNESQQLSDCRITAVRYCRRPVWRPRVGSVCWSLPGLADRQRVAPVAVPRHWYR